MEQRRRFLRIGLVGIAVFVALNAFAYLVLGQAAAIPFSKLWWSSWFPALLPFFVFAVVGVFSCRSSAKEGLPRR